MRFDCSGGSDGVIHTLTKRGLSQPPEVFGERGFETAEIPLVKVKEGLISWKIMSGWI